MPIEEHIISDTEPLPKPQTQQTRNKRVEDTLTQVLEGEKVDEIISRLSDTEQELFRNLVNEIRRGDHDGLKHLEELWRVDYVRKPPTIEEFITDDYYLGNVLKPSQENPGIFPTWKNILINDFDLDSRIHNVVITGSLGTGKTYIMIGGIFLYRIALARLLKNPQFFFGLSKGSRIFYAILSLSREVVRDTAFGDLTNFMANSPFFKEECGFDPDKKYSDSRIPLGNNVWISAGSKGWHVIGRNVMGVCLDEGNWRLETNPDETAYRLYDEVRTRIQNRFQKVSGFLPAISVLSSSARDESSFTEKVINDIENVNDTTTQVVYRHAIYHIKQHMLSLKNRWFKVHHGLKNVEPSILRGWYNKQGQPIDEDENIITDTEKIKETHEQSPSGASVELIPEDYIDAFVRNCSTALQSISGISTGASHRLFPSVVNIERAVELSVKDGVVNPSNLTYIPISQEDDKNVWDYLEHPRFLTRRHSRIIPIRHPDARRYGHVDLATQSMAGVAICHRVGRKKVVDIRDGVPFEEFRLIIEYDFILTIVAGKRKPISLEKIQRFFFWLRDICGYRFGLVTADQWQSVLTLEMMQTRNFTTKQLSLDKKKGPYHSWRAGFDDMRIRLYRQDQLMREAERLIENPKKIDHPADGSKDTTDAAAGAYFNAITDDIVQSSVPVSEPTIFSHSDSESTENVASIEINKEKIIGTGKSRTFEA